MRLRLARPYAPLLVALTDPTCEDRWYKGETVFPVIPEALDA